jgi:hypothetical protein
MIISASNSREYDKGHTKKINTSKKKRKDWKILVKLECQWSNHASHQTRQSQYQNWKCERITIGKDRNLICK